MVVPLYVIEDIEETPNIETNNAGLAVVAIVTEILVVAPACIPGVTAVPCTIVADASFAFRKKQQKKTARIIVSIFFFIVINFRGRINSVQYISNSKVKLPHS